MEESFGALLSQLPSDTEVPGLLEDITNKTSYLSVSGNDTMNAQMSANNTVDYGYFVSDFDTIFIVTDKNANSI